MFRWYTNYFKHNLREKLVISEIIDTFTFEDIISSHVRISYRFYEFVTTRIIHHNQLLFIKFGKNLCHIESMSLPKIIEPVTSKWRQKCSLPQIIELLTAKTWGHGCVIYGERKNKERNGKTQKEEIFWMNNKAIIEFGFLRIWRILQISEGVIHLGLRPQWITPSLICRILHILLSLIQ